MNTELSSEAKRLIEASRGFDEASFEDRARVRAGLSAQLAAGAGVVALGGASHLAGAKGWAVNALSGPLPKAALAMAVATGVAIGVATRWPHTKTPMPAPSPAASLTSAAVSNPTPAAASNPRASKPSAKAAAPGLSGGSAEPPASAPLAAPARELAPKALPQLGARPEKPAAPQGTVPRATARQPAIADGSSAPNEGQLNEELRLLSAARAQLKQGAPERALERLSEYRARFPAGALTVEGSALQVDALCGAGQKAAARTAADDFLKAWPGSPLAARVRAACQ